LGGRDSKKIFSFDEPPDSLVSTCSTGLAGVDRRIAILDAEATGASPWLRKWNLPRRLDGAMLRLTRILSTRYPMNPSHRRTKESVVLQTRIISYRFSAFARAIDVLPVSEIKPTAEDYQKCIVWDLERRNVRPNRNIQNILAFWRFLHSNKLPQGLSRFERRFYLLTVARMVRHALLPTKVLDQFRFSGSKESVETKNSSSLRGRRNLTNRPSSVEIPVVQTTLPRAGKLRR